MNRCSCVYTVKYSELVVASVLASKLTSAGAAGAEDLLGVGVTEVNDGSTFWGDGSSRTPSRRVSEGDGAEVGEGNQAATFLEILDNPLSISLAKGARGISEGVVNRLARTQVLKSSNTRSRARGGDGDLDLIADAQIEAAEGVRVIWDPLKPSIEAAIAVEGETSLKDRGLAGITVNTNPGRGSSITTARGTGNGDGSSNTLETVSNLDSSRPVGGVLNLGGVGTLDEARAVGDALAGRALNELLATGSGGSKSKESKDSGELHSDDMLQEQDVGREDDIGYWRG